MHIDAVLTPAEIDHLPERDLTDTTCVVFDVLRATSSIVTGLAHGVDAFYPVATVEEALALRRELGDVVLGGERHGDRIDGFDIGNSPLEYIHLAGRRVVTTTTNGTVALRACVHAHEVIVGALLNVDAVVAHLEACPTGRVLLVCAGTFRQAALEDVLAAGAVAEALLHAQLSDAARATAAVHRQSAGDYLGVLRQARNGLALARNGRGDEVAFCAQRSRWSIVGIQRGREICAARVPASGTPRG